jgi:hypothetical protein
MYINEIGLFLNIDKTYANIYHANNESVDHIPMNITTVCMDIYYTFIFFYTAQLQSSFCFL